MKAMVLAAGRGERMWPLTLLRAKPVLPVLNRPLVQGTLERLARAGARDVVVNLHHLPDTVTEALGDGSRFGLRLRYSRERQLLGTGGGPRAVRDFLGNEPFLLINGDVLFELDLGDLLARHRASGALATLALRPNPGGYSPVVTDRRGFVLSIAGRPRRARGTVSMFASVHVMEPSLLDRLPRGRSETVPDLYLPLLAAGGRLLGVRTRGAWYDFGRPSLYRDAQLRLVRGKGGGPGLVDPRARIGHHASLVGSVVGAEARVGAGARVKRSILWEGAVVEPGARVSGAIVATGGVVRTGEHAARVTVLPAARLRGSAPGRFRVRGDMAWVEID